MEFHGHDEWDIGASLWNEGSFLSIAGNGGIAIFFAGCWGFFYIYDTPGSYE